MIEITLTDGWREAHPGGAIGLLELSGVDNTGSSAALDERKRETEAALRARFADFTRRDFLALPVIAAYSAYYRRFEKTYHVLLQLESIALKGKRLPSVSPLVDAAFSAEVLTQVCVASHDADKLAEPVVMDVSRPGDILPQMGGGEKAIRPGDMVMRDALGLCCSIMYGQDSRSPVTPATRRVLYVAYAPAGVPGEAVAAQLEQMEANARLFAPGAVVEQRRVLRG